MLLVALVVVVVVVALVVVDVLVDALLHVAVAVVVTESASWVVVFVALSHLHVSIPSTALTWNNGYFRDNKHSSPIRRGTYAPKTLDCRPHILPDTSLKSNWENTSGVKQVPCWTSWVREPGYSRVHLCKY